MSTSIAVDIQKIYGRYPQKIYNNGNDNGTETLGNGTTVGNITINAAGVIGNPTLNYSNGFNLTDVLTLKFEDKRWRSGGGGFWNSNNSTWTATCTVADLLNGNVTLEFKR